MAGSIDFTSAFTILDFGIGFKKNGMVFLDFHFIFTHTVSLC